MVWGVLLQQQFWCTVYQQAANVFRGGICTLEDDLINAVPLDKVNWKGLWMVLTDVDERQVSGEREGYA